MTSYLAPHQCFNTTFMRTGNHDTRAVCIFMFLQRKKQTNHKSALTLKLKNGLTCKETILQLFRKTKTKPKHTHTRFFQCLSQLCRVTELQLLKRQFMLLRDVLILQSKNKGFPVFSHTEKIYFLPILFFLLRAMKQ